MPRPQLILPRADAACGKTFFSDRRTADGHRIALEVWNRATGRGREGYRLMPYRCKRCGGYHLAQRPIDRVPTDLVPPPPDHDPDPIEGREFEILHVRRFRWAEPV